MISRHLSLLRQRKQNDEKRITIRFILSGIFINASLVLTTGMFLSGYIVFLGGSDFLVGLMNNSVNWAAIAGLFSFLIYERLAKRKIFLVTLLALSRFLVGSVIFLPLFIADNRLILTLVSVLVIVGNILWGIYSIGYNIWIMNSFPKGVRSSFVFRRTFYLRIALTLANLIMGFVLDWSGKSYRGFLIVFATSLLLSLFDVLTILGIKEPDYALGNKKKFTFRSFAEPVHNKAYRKFLIFIFLFYAAISLSSSYTSLYLLRYLNLDYKIVSLVTIIANFFMIVSTRFWRVAQVRWGLKRVFQLSAFIAALEFLFYFFLNSKTLPLLFFAPFFSGVGNSGFNIFVMNHRYDLMPPTNHSLFEGWYGALLGLSLLLGPILGNVIMNVLPQIENVVFEFSQFQLIYLLSFLLSIPILFLLQVEVDNDKLPPV